jgi:hypothetical protein
MDIASFINNEMLEKEISMKDATSKVSYAIVEAMLWFSLALPLFIVLLD